MEGEFLMLIYSIIMLPVSILLITFSILIYKGNTGLIHDYHQTKVTDKKAYGKAFGKALAVVGLAPLLSGLIGFLGDSKQIAVIAVAVLIAFLCIGIVCICTVQKKYNGGIF